MSDVPKRRGRPPKISRQPSEPLEKLIVATAEQKSAQQSVRYVYLPEVIVREAARALSIGRLYANLNLGRANTEQRDLILSDIAELDRIRVLYHEALKRYQ